MIFLPLPSNAIRWYHSTHVDLKAFTFSFFLTFCRDNIHRHRQLCLHFNIKCSLKACCLAFDACPHFFFCYICNISYMHFTACLLTMCLIVVYIFSGTFEWFSREYGLDIDVFVWNLNSFNVLESIISYEL